MSVKIPGLDLSGIEKGLSDKANYQAIVDLLQRNRKDLNFYLMNLSLDNMPTVSDTVDGIHSNIADIEGNMSLIEQSVDSILLSVADIEGNVSSLQIQADGIQTQVTNLADSTSSSITQLSDSISLKVSAGDVVTMLNIDQSGLQIKASNIDLSGITTVYAPTNPSNRFTMYGNGVALYTQYGKSLDIYDNGYAVVFNGILDFSQSSVSGLPQPTPVDFHPNSIDSYFAANKCYLDYGGGTRITVRDSSGTVAGYIDLT